MSLKYGVFWILLLFVVIFLAIKTYGTWTQPMELSLGKGGEKKTEAKAEVPPPVTSTREPPSIESYIFIAEKNIFHPERKEFPIPAAAGTKKPIARPQIILYGVTILGDYQTASITNPGRPLRKGERETMTVKQGDQIGEYKLAKILPDRITLEAAEDSFEVLLYDPKMPKKRTEIKTESKPPTITSTSPTPAAKPAEASKTPPPAVPVEKPKDTPPEKVSTPPLPTPVTPTSPPYTPRRGRPPYPPETAPTKEGGL